MPFTLESAQSIFSGMAPSPIPAVLAEVDNLSIEERLALLWLAYTEIGASITRAALGSASMNLIENLLGQIRSLPPMEQTQVMFDIASRADTPISRTYSYFSANTKLGFWYQLAEWMTGGSVAPIPNNYQMTDAANQVFRMIQNLDVGQQIQILREIVLNMGYDPAVEPAKIARAEEFQFERAEDAPLPQIVIEGINEPTPVAYFEAMNRDNFEAAVALFSPNGALQPPFQKPIVGPEAVMAYMREEAQGLTMMPERGLVETNADGSKQVRVTGKVLTPWFGVNVAMNIAWRFALTADDKIFFVAIDMLASPQELLNLKPPSYT